MDAEGCLPAFLAGMATASAVLVPAVVLFMQRQDQSRQKQLELETSDVKEDDEPLAKASPEQRQGFADEDLMSDSDFDDEDDDDDDDDEEPLKQVMVVRTDLKMGKGKIAAQCCHASLGAFRRASSPRAPEVWQTWLRRWLIIGQTKVAVKCPSEEEMAEVAENARANNVPFYVVADAGRTQIAAGSRTVCAVGPAPVSVVDALCSQFKLL